MDPMVSAGGSPSSPGDDPVVMRRARIARGVGLAKRTGYSLLLIAMASFIIAAVTGFTGAAVTVTVVALITACVVLPVPIVMGYGLRAAEREDREADTRRAGGNAPDGQR
jgi:NADH:ubiquinone oxidoreductase subunit 6 (subunit J)